MEYRGTTSETGTGTPGGPEGVEFHAENAGIEFTPDRGAAGDGAQSGMRGAVSRLGERAKDGITSRLEDRKSRAADTLGGVAHALLAASDQLGSQQEGAARPYVERLAHQVDRVSNFLEQTDVEQVADDVGQFARRHPALFIGGALALGIVGARFLKSSGRHVHEEASSSRRMTQMGYPPADGAYGATGTPSPSGIGLGANTGIRETEAGDPRIR